MRMAVIERDGVLHYALRGAGPYSPERYWYVFCDQSNGKRPKYFDGQIQIKLPTCVRCLGEEALRGKDFEPIQLD